MKKKDNKEKDKQEKSGGKPSMKMRKDELLAIAAERGIDIPEKITKKEILELINADDPENKQNRKKTGNKQDRNKNGNDQSRNKTGNKQDRKQEK